MDADSDMCPLPKLHYHGKAVRGRQQVPNPFQQNNPFVHPVHVSSNLSYHQPKRLRLRSDLGILLEYHFHLAIDMLIAIRSTPQATDGHHSAWSHLHAD